MGVDAFVKESEEQRLREIEPTLNVLIIYLTRENNGVKVYEQNNYPDAKSGKTIHVMGNGLSYLTDGESKWYVVFQVIP